jgi:negative regulator of flagellin synthesis FlgM
MKINQYTEGLKPFEDKKVERADGERSQKAQGAAGDKVTLSEEAKLRAEAVKVALADDGMRAERVAELKKQVADGEYETDSRSLAEKLLRDDLDTFV